MSEIGVSEAKTNLTRLLDRVEKGERIVITRHGRPVAELAPLRRQNPERVRMAIKRLRAQRARLEPVGLTMKQLIAEGRRF